MAKNKIFVTQPALPPLEEFLPYLKEIWESKWLTNNGPFHERFEAELAEYLGVKYISLFSNATLALITALQALRITGEVITTPFSFVATTHSLWWNGITPVFVDIEPEYLNIDTNKIEKAITPKTTAILPVHVYGNPCNVEEIQRIADTYNLKVIYDAAHAFGVKKNGESILNFGDLSILSFHATKVFNTFEGGAIICHDAKMKRHIDDLKNFGFRDEVTVVAPGINAKMNEIQASFGLLQLKHVNDYILKRKNISDLYSEKLEGKKGVTIIHSHNNCNPAFTYYPILIDAKEYGMSRDTLYDKLKSENFYSRRYFYPLISNFPTYRSLPSASFDNLPIANRISEQILCLPFYPALELNYVNEICNVICQS